MGLIKLILILCINIFIILFGNIYFLEGDFLLSSGENPQDSTNSAMGDNSSIQGSEKNGSQEPSGPNGSKEDPISISSSSSSSSDDDDNSSIEDWVNNPDLCRCDHIKGNPCDHCTHTESEPIPLVGQPGRCCICEKEGANMLCTGGIDVDCECIFHDYCVAPGLDPDSNSSADEALENTKKHSLEDSNREEGSSKRR